MKRDRAGSALEIEGLPGSEREVMKVLLLAGTPESVQIGRALARDRSVSAMAAVKRASRVPTSLGIPSRVGGWGSSEAFEDWLASEPPLGTTIQRLAETLSESGDGVE